MLTDALSKGGLNVPKLEGPVVDELKSKLFPGAAVGNPIDILATGTPDHLRLCLEYCEEKFDNIDAVLAIFGTPDGYEDVLCIGNDKTMQFLEDVMSEIIEIFPSEYVHIGGDEAPRTRWEKCPKCQARIKAEGLKADKKHTAEDRLQSYCMTRIEKFLKTAIRN